MNLLLLSNSTCHGKECLAHALPWIKELFPENATVLFIPYAFPGYGKNGKPAYRADTSGIDALKKIGITIVAADKSADPIKLLKEKLVDGVYVEGGNTYELLNKLYETNLLDAIDEAVTTGIPYLGSSAGTNIAGPTIKTTNDMPIVQPPSFRALGLVNFQINPHYIDADPHSTHRGETRETRLREYISHPENRAIPVVALYEGSALRVENSKLLLLGNKPAKVFCWDEKTQAIKIHRIPPTSINIVREDPLFPGITTIINNLHRSVIQCPVVKSNVRH